MSRDIIFGMVADVHQGKGGVDASDRMKIFVDEAAERKADFIIQLGDFILPDAMGQKLLDVWNGFDGPRYHVLGNHDMEHCSKEAIMRFQGQAEKYYSFDCGDYHFIVLDTNYYRMGDKYFDYYEGDYDRSYFNCYIPTEQLKWMEDDISKTDKRCFIFTHAVLAAGDWKIYNLNILHDYLWLINQRAGYNKVTMCFSGHDHADVYRYKGGIHYMVVNSMSHKFIDPLCATDSSNAEAVKKDYGKTEFIIQYKDPLYAFVRLKQNGLIQIIGKQTEYVGNSPIELHWEHYASPEIRYREVWMNGHGEL